MNDKKWTIYCHIAIDGRRYVGITSNNPKRRWDCGRGYKSNLLFYNYIKKYGWNNIKHEILFDNLTEEEAKEKEIYYIKLWNTQNKQYGFNLTAGGDSGNSPNEETRKKMSIARRKRIISEETKLKISNSVRGEKNGFYGKTHTKEAREKISQAQKCRVGYYKGKTLTEEHKRKIGLKSLYRNAKKVRCIETGEVYLSIGDASKEYNIKNQTSIGMCCKKQRKTAHGLHWEYI